MQYSIVILKGGKYGRDVKNAKDILRKSRGGRKRKCKQYCKIISSVF